MPFRVSFPVFIKELWMNCPFKPKKGSAMLPFLSQIPFNGINRHQVCFLRLFLFHHHFPFVVEFPLMPMGAVK
jgi:hypothetical protein